MKIAVLGAGITGLSIAEELRRDGHQVVLIDRVMPGDPGQTSFGNAGLLANFAVVPIPVPGLLAKAPWMVLNRDSGLFLRWAYLPRMLPWLARYMAHARPADVERISATLAMLVSDTLEAHQRLAAGTGAERYIEERRCIFLYPGRAGWEKETLQTRLRRAAGLDWDLLDRDALLAQDPELGPDQGFGIAYKGGGHLTDPGAYSAALFGHFCREGGRFLRGEIADLRSEEAGVSVAVGGETIAAERAVLAMGAFSGRLAERLGHKARLEAERGYHMMLEGPSHMPPEPYILVDGKMAVTPMDGGLRVAGLTEFGGLRARPSPRATAMQRRRLARLYPRLTWSGERIWMGRRPTTVDSLPVIGEAPKAKGVYFAFGAQHIGLTIGPKTGRLIADMIAGRTPNLELADCRAGRFDG